MCSRLDYRDLEQEIKIAYPLSSSKSAMSTAELDPGLSSSVPNMFWSCVGVMIIKEQLAGLNLSN